MRGRRDARARRVYEFGLQGRNIRSFSSGISLRPYFFMFIAACAEVRPSPARGSVSLIM